MNKNLEANRNRTLSEGIHKNIKVRAPKIDKTAISPYDRYCDGYGMPGAYGNGYVSVLKVSVGTVKKTDDILLDGIVSYDRAEIMMLMLDKLICLQLHHSVGLQVKFGDMI